MTPEDALAQIRAHSDPEIALKSGAYHKAPRSYLGVPTPVLNDMTTEWRRSLPIGDRLVLADGLWRSDIHEARVAAAKLLTQARIRPDDTATWALICSWVPQFDAWAIADHACMAGQRRVMADLSRLDEVENWTRADHIWTRRAALVVTLGLTRANFPSAKEEAGRDRVLVWAEGYLDSREWFIHKAIAWWLRDLSKHDPARVRNFLALHGGRLQGFARKEAAKYL